MIEFLIKSAGILALFLMFSYGLSLAAHMHWFFSLLSQFKIQFFFGAVLLLPILLIGKSYPAAAIMVLIGVSAFIEIYNASPIIEKENKAESEYFTVMQYNKLYTNKSYDRVTDFVLQQEIDVLIMQEVEHEDSPPLANALAQNMPHSIPDDIYRPDFVSIFSKHPIKNLTVQKLCETPCTTHGVRFDMQIEDTDITVYTIHTKTPIGKNDYIQHSKELDIIAQWIKSDARETVILAGDFNTTPFTPAFKKMKATAQLDNTRFSIIEQGTWPAWGILPIFKIPIDHIMHKGDIRLINKHKGPAMGSDHHSLIATYAIE